MKNKNLSIDEILFIENFNLILTNSQRIITTPAFYTCKPKFISMSNPYGAPQNNLGNLCILWKAGKFMDRCHSCGGRRYIVGGSGNLGGGISDNRGICISCKEFRHKSGPEKGPSIYMPLLRATMDFREKEIFKDYRDFKPLNLSELVIELKK